MNAHSVFTPTVKTVLIGFLAFTASLVAFATIGKLGLFEPASTSRAVSLLIGVLMVFVGNLLPKLRPFSLPGSNRQTTISERFAGWILVLAGLTCIALFLFAPLDQAKRVSALIGIATLVVIAANWIWQARSVLFRSRAPVDASDAESKSFTERRNLLIWLLFSFFYVLALFSMKNLSADEGWARSVGVWGSTVFWMAFAALHVVLARKDVRRC